MAGDSIQPLTDLNQQRERLLPVLLSAASYRPPVREVELIETHISWVFLTDHYVYKLKKAIDLGFVDYRDPATRRRMCREEVRLNRRLADRVYLGVLPITQRVGGPPVLVDAVQGGGGPNGDAVDWVVAMRRLDAAHAVDQRIRQGVLTSVEVERIAKRLVEFYRQCTPVEMAAVEYRSHFEGRVRNNLAELANAKHGLDAALVDRVHGRQLQYWSLAGQEADARAEANRIVDGHGDLRPEHIFLDSNSPGAGCDIIDCVEFSVELRTVDVADELAFLAMEFHRLGADWAGDQVRRCYQRDNGDLIPDRLFDFYQCYRACVRAKVAVLRGDQVDPEKQQVCRRQAAEYLALAEQFSGRFGRPLVVIISGLSGSGKSTLAAAIAQRWRAAWLRTDQIRNEMFGEDRRSSKLDEGVYRPEARAAVYAKMTAAASELLAAGRTVILDGTFQERQYIDRSIQLARGHAATAILVHCQCSADVAVARIARRRQSGDLLSDADADVYRRQRETAEQDEQGTGGIGPPRGVAVLDLDTTDSIEEQVDSLLRFAANEIRRVGEDE